MELDHSVNIYKNELTVTNEQSRLLEQFLNLNFLLSYTKYFKMKQNKINAGHVVLT